MLEKVKGYINSDWQASQNILVIFLEDRIAIAKQDHNRYNSRLNCHTEKETEK